MQTARNAVTAENGGESATAEPDQHLAMHLQERRDAAEKAMHYHSVELERWQRIGRASHAGLAELANEDDCEPASLAGANRAF